MFLMGVGYGFCGVLCCFMLYFERERERMMVIVDLASGISHILVYLDTYFIFEGKLT